MFAILSTHNRKKDLFSTCTILRHIDIFLATFNLRVKHIVWYFQFVNVDIRVDKPFTDKWQSVDIKTASNIHKNTTGPA
jgi:hypothetical protein